MPNLLTRRDLEGLLRVSRPTFWRLAKRADFPRPVQITGRTLRWSSSEVEAWLVSRQRPAAA